MLAHTHTVFGIFLSTTFLSVFGVSLSLHWSVITIAILGALIPDIDLPKSTIGRLFPIISKPLERKFGHRTITHSLIGLIIATTIFTILLWLIAIAIQLQKHLPDFANYTEFTTEILNTLGISINDFNPWALPKRWPAAFAVGYLSHLILDMFNPSGVQLLWPNKTRDIFFANPKFRPASGSKAEIPIFIGLTCLMLLSFPISKHGLHTSLRWLLATPDSAIAEFKTLTHQSFVDFKGQYRDNKHPISGKAELIDIQKKQLIISLNDTLYTLSDELSADIVASHTRLLKTNIPVHVTSVTFTQKTKDDLLARLTPTARISGSITLPDNLTLTIPPTPEHSTFRPLTQKNATLILTYATRADIQALGLTDQFQLNQEKNKTKLTVLNTQLAQLTQTLHTLQNPNDGLTESGRNLLLTDQEKQRQHNKIQTTKNTILTTQLKIKEQKLAITRQALKFSGTVRVRTTQHPLADTQQNTQNERKTQ